MKNQLLFQVLENSHQLIKSEAFFNRHRLNEKHFSRHRKWSFSLIIFFILNFLKQSLQVEINRFNSTFISNNSSFTKSAFSKARKKISPLAFKELFELSSTLWLNSGSFKCFNSYRIFAIDGSVIQLPKDSSKWLSDFGLLGNQHGYSALRGRSSILCDVLSGVVIHADFDCISTGERQMAFKHLDFFEPFSTEKDLIIFDRGYPSFELISSFFQRKSKFLMRVPKCFNPSIDASSEKDFIVTFRYKKHSYNIRAVKVVLPTGEVESLITNLSPDEFSHSDFLTLYFMRWPVETKYNTVKNKLFLETFSGKTSIAINQDFYTTMYLANLTAFAKLESDAIIFEDNKDKNLKYAYQTNENVLIGLLKTNLISIFLYKSNTTKKKKLKALVEQAATHRTAIRPGRFHKRPKKKNKWVINCINKAKTAL